MARDLSAQQGVDNTDGDYVNGKLVDGANGTLVGEGINQDIVQFFQKLMDSAGIVPNGDPDNEANGYQFLEALAAFTVNPENWRNFSYQSGASAISTNNKGLQYRKLASGDVHLLGSFQVTSPFSATSQVFSMIYQPVAALSIGLLLEQGGGYTDVTLLLNTDGTFDTKDPLPIGVYHINEIIALT